MQHGGPPSALMTRAIEGLPEAEGRVIGRIVVELLGPVPVAPVSVATSVVRTGRSVALIEATLSTDRPVARATAWLFPDLPSGLPSTDRAPASEPGDGVLREFPGSWSAGYLDATEWRWVSGELGDGRAAVWMRPRVSLVDDEPWSPIPRLMSLVDSASGVASALDPADWLFINTDLTVHVVRRPVGEWLYLEAETMLTSTSVGLATSSVYDEQGLVARTAQALLVAKR